MADRMRAQDFDSDGYSCPDGEARYSFWTPDCHTSMVTYSGKTEHEEIILSAKFPLVTVHDKQSNGLSVTHSSLRRTNTGCSYVRCCDRVIWTTEEFLKEKREENGERTERDFE